MIKRYTDHAANERTYLAWIRTAITIIAFGFLIEKFEIFLSYVGMAVKTKKYIQPSFSAELIGLSFFLVGVLIIVTSTVRFFIYKKAIETEEHFSYSVKRTNILLSTMVISMSLFLFFYIASQLI